MLELLAPFANLDTTAWVSHREVNQTYASSLPFAAII